MARNANQCAFCHAAAEGAFTVVAQTDAAWAVMDAAPVAPGHVLVIPRRHVESVGELTGEEGTALWSLAQQMSRRVRERFAPAVNWHLADGAEADQDVPHVHLHVIPRRRGDAVRIHVPGARVPVETLRAAAAQLLTDDEP